MQNGWIERLFSRFAALYGAAFGRQWEGTNLSDVKAIWAEKLGGFNAQQIGDALKSCDDKPYPPNLPEFLELCRNSAKRVTRGDLLALPPARNNERGMQRLAAIRSMFKRDESYDFLGWAKSLKSDYIDGAHLLPIQISMASEALDEIWENRICRPRKADDLGMKKAES